MAPSLTVVEKYPVNYHTFFSKTLVLWYVLYFF